MRLNSTVFLATLFPCVLLSSVAWYFSFPPTGEALLGLETAGRLAGISGFTLLCMQFSFAARPRFPERSLGLAPSIRFHAFASGLGILLSSLHARVDSAQAVSPMRGAGRFAGSFALAAWLLVTLAVFLSLSRNAASDPGLVRRKRGFSLSSMLSRAAATALLDAPLVIAPLACVHAMSGSGQSPVPSMRYWYLAVFVLAWAILVLRRFSARPVPCRISRMRQAGPRLLQVSLVPDTPLIRGWEPGQYAYIRLKVPGLPDAYRPCTIVAAPERGGPRKAAPGIAASGPELLFTLGVDDDWTMRLYDSIPSFNDRDTENPRRAVLDYPYGLFTLQRGMPRSARDGPMVFIAEGLGINPFLCMLGHLSQAGSVRRILVLWMADTRDQLAGIEYLDSCAKRLPGLSMIPILKADPLWEGQRGSLDEHKLSELTAFELGSGDCSWWVSCTAASRKNVIKKLRSLGVPESRIRHEDSLS